MLFNRTWLEIVEVGEFQYLGYDVSLSQKLEMKFTDKVLGLVAGYSRFRKMDSFKDGRIFKLL